MINLFIDIETIPSEIMPAIEDVKVPGNISKPETILKYQTENQVESWKKQALDSMQGRIICIGYALDDEIIHTHAGDEFETLEKFDNAIMLTRGRYFQPITFIGWNISTFDLPWLWRKAIQCNLPSLRDSIVRNSKDLVIDLMKVWAAEYRDYVSLANVAKFLSIPHEGGDGSEIFDLWQAGDMEAIAGHCRRDIETTVAVYRRIYE